MKSAWPTSAAERPMTGPLSPTTRILVCSANAAVTLRLLAAKLESQCLCEALGSEGAARERLTSAPLWWLLAFLAKDYGGKAERGEELRTQKRSGPWRE